MHTETKHDQPQLYTRCLNERPQPNEDVMLGFCLKWLLEEEPQREDQKEKNWFSKEPARYRFHYLYSTDYQKDLLCTFVYHKLKNDSLLQSFYDTYRVAQYGKNTYPLFFSAF